MPLVDLYLHYEQQEIFRARAENSRAKIWGERSLIAGDTTAASRNRREALRRTDAENLGIAEQIFRNPLAEQIRRHIISAPHSHLTLLPGCREAQSWSKTARIAIPRRSFPSGSHGPIAREERFTRGAPTADLRPLR